MKFLLLNQTFYPDVVSTAQHLADLAVALAGRGHAVRVIASRRAYDHPEQTFPKSESWRGIQIDRIATTAFGKQAKWRRAADFASFIAACCLRLLFTPRPDVVVALTSPPLISFIGAVYAKWSGARFIYWVMDLNPDEAIAAGWLREESLAARGLHSLSRFSFRHAHKVIALDRFMKARIEGKGIAPEKIAVLPPWSHDEAVRFDAAGRQRFRQAHGLADKFVVMYSGNHSPCHPLDTLLGAALALAADTSVAFLFVGGGSEWRKIQEQQKAERGQPDSDTTDDGRRDQNAGSGKRTTEDGNLTRDQTGHKTRNPEPGTRNILCLPYQPLSELAGSLSAADLHTVVMGEPFVGLIHPCKIYNVLSVGAPVMCIGPRPSHLSEILDALGSSVCATVSHGDVAACVAAIKRIQAGDCRGEPGRYESISGRFAQKELLPRLVAELEKV